MSTREPMILRNGPEGRDVVLGAHYSDESSKTIAMTGAYFRPEQVILRRVYSNQQQEEIWPLNNAEAEAFVAAWLANKADQERRLVEEQARLAEVSRFARQLADIADIEILPIMAEGEIAAYKVVCRSANTLRHVDAGDPDALLAAVEQTVEAMRVAWGTPAPENESLAQKGTTL
jgi:hypothetical protein